MQPGAAARGGRQPEDQAARWELDRRPKNPAVALAGTAKPGAFDAVTWQEVRRTQIRPYDVVGRLHYGLWKA
jgi:hypothetical protein